MTAHLIMHPAIARDHDPLAIAAALGMKLTMLQSRVEEGVLARLDREFRERSETPIIFASIPVARRIQHRHPWLAHGIDLPVEFLRHSHYSSIVDPSLLLNPCGIYLPWSRILPARAWLQNLFGTDVFLRPDRSTKPFPGFAIGIDDLEREVSARTQTDHVDPGELVFISKVREIPPLEFRVWIVENRPVAASAYSWDAGAELPAVPSIVWDRAAELGRHLEQHQPSMTADYAVIEGEPLLVELNAISTSGWYRELDPAALVAAVAQASF